MIAYAEKLPGLGELTLIPLDPAAHASLVHGWVVRPRNRFWGMGGHTVDQVREIYEFVAGLSTHHAYLIRIDEAPIGIFQTYEPEHDPIAECYPVQPGDFGLHLLLDGGDLVLPHLSTLVIPALLRYAFADPVHRRLIAEPDIRNSKAIRRFERHGFELGPEIDLGRKRARLTFLTRSRFWPPDARLRRPGAGAVGRPPLGRPSLIRQGVMPGHGWYPGMPEPAVRSRSASQDRKYRASPRPRCTPHVVRPKKNSMKPSGPRQTRKSAPVASPRPATTTARMTRPRKAQQTMVSHRALNAMMR